MAFRILLLIGLCATTSDADIYRWDTGEVIPGTEGITPGPGVDLSGMNLAYAPMPDPLFSSDGEVVGYTGASFRSSNLEFARFGQRWACGFACFSTGIGLSNVDFSCADLSRADLAFTRLEGANFADAVIAGTNFKNSNLSRAQLYSTRSYAEKDLRRIVLGADFDLFPFPQDGEQTFDTWDLTGHNLSGSVLRHAHFSDAKFNDATLAGADLSQSSCTNADFTGANLSDVDLEGVRIQQSVLRNSDLFGTNLANSMILDSDLRSVDLEGANLRFSQLTESDLRDSSLGGATMLRTGLKNTDLGGADLRNANLTAAHEIEFAVFDETSLINQWTALSFTFDVASAGLSVVIVTDRAKSTATASWLPPTSMSYLKKSLIQTPSRSV